MAIAYGHYFAGLIAQFSLKGATSMSLDKPFQHYQNFFIHLALLALCVCLTHVVYFVFKYAIVKSKEIKNGSSYENKKRAIVNVAYTI